MDNSTQTIQADFDRIALLPSSGGWDHNNHYHPFLLKHLPAHIGAALDIGCGTGDFARLLAARADRVLALDLAPNMIRVAQERSKAFSNIDFQMTDVTTYDLPKAHFDFVASIATLHHLPLGDMLTKMKDALKPGGTLLVLDLYQADIVDLLAGIVVVPLNLVMELLKNGRRRAAPEVQQAWADHNQHDTFLKLAEIRRICLGVLPGAWVRRHVFWRYSIVWKKAAF
jgi:ubiquinone/menaquinone biosynthesis C-methylase UbiE